MKLSILNECGDGCCSMIPPLSKDEEIEELRKPSFDKIKPIPGDWQIDRIENSIKRLESMIMQIANKLDMSFSDDTQSLPTSGSPIRFTYTFEEEEDL